jgi:hypothetical protein
MCSCAHLEHKRRNVSEQDVFEQTLYSWTVQHTLLVVFYVIKQKENHSLFSQISQNFGMILIKCRIEYLLKKRVELLKNSWISVL